jgi:hypothetical protein
VIKKPPSGSPHRDAFDRLAELVGAIGCSDARRAHRASLLVTRACEKWIDANEQRKTAARRKRPTPQKTKALPAPRVDLRRVSDADLANEYNRRLSDGWCP